MVRSLFSRGPGNIKITTGVALDNMIKRMWKKEGALKFEKLKIPPELQELGVKIYDALDVAREPQSYDVKVEDIQETAQSFPNVSSQNFYLFNEKVETTETQDQALCLTKTIMYREFPSVLKSLIGIEKIPNQKKLVQRCISQSLIKDGQMIKLPRKPDPSKPWFKFPREYGIDLDRKVVNLVQKLSLLCDLGCAKYPESYARQRILNPFTETIIERGKDTIVFQMLGDVLYTSPKPLKPAASPEEIIATKDMSLPDIYPVKPTLDLEKHEISPAKLVDDIHLLDDTRHLTPSYVHTLHVAHKGERWENEQQLSRAINGSFTYVANEAKRLYGNEVKLLPQPVCIQCVYSDSNKFGFLFYQLNTLDFSTDEGVKNQVWVEEAQPLFEPERRSEIHLWEILGIKNYNDEIFSKMLAFYLNGIHPSTV